jgi:Uma2 family endonuclease
MELVLDYNKRYTYADYLTWADDKMRELINGFVKLMSPAPAAPHQIAGSILHSKLSNIVARNKGNCIVLYAPFDARFPQHGEIADDKIYTGVQPDICVVCDLSKIDKKGCLGAPDLIVEIQSPSTAKYDLNEKFNLYEKSGVSEYWVVFPYDETIQVFLLQPDGKYDKGAIYENGNVPVGIFGVEEIEIESIFSLARKITHNS